MQKRLWLLAGLIPVAGVLASCTTTTTFDTSELEEKIEGLEERIAELESNPKFEIKTTIYNVGNTSETGGYWNDKLEITYYSYDNDYVTYIYSDVKYISYISITEVGDTYSGTKAVTTPSDLSYRYTKFWYENNYIKLYCIPSIGGGSYYTYTLTSEATFTF